VLPVLFKLGEVPIYGYGLARLLSHGVAAALLIITARRLNEPLANAVRTGLGLIVGAVVGGRVGFVLVSLREPEALEQLFSISGGFLYQTSLLGGLIALPLTALAQRRSIATAFDLVTPPLFGGWAVGNIGCLLAGCCFGAPSTLPWAVRITAAGAPAALPGVAVHPAPLYSMLVEAAVLVALFALPRRFRGELCLRALAVLLAMRVTFAAAGVGPGRFGPLTIAELAVAALAGCALVLLRRSVLNSSDPAELARPEA
jgi:phosphatidylglycerol:prolipoprotein diacylglycerol transferase